MPVSVIGPLIVLTHLIYTTLWVTYKFHGTGEQADAHWNKTVCL